jgi:hypothetical protein
MGGGRLHQPHEVGGSSTHHLDTAHVVRHAAE